MVTKIHKGQAGGNGGEGSSAKRSNAQLSDTVKESAQQIWLAGLGAFSKAQEEGGKVFEALVSEGMTLQKKTQSAAEQKVTEATSKMASMATDLSSKASGQWDKLENIFEERVSRALKKLGVPSAKDVEALMARMDKLERGGGGASRAAGKTTAAKKAVRKTPRKSSSAR